MTNDVVQPNLNIEEDLREKVEQIKSYYQDDKNDITMIEKAFQTAKRLHQNQKRLDGSPYITHPVEVALILARLNFNAEVICGALLHDVVEDCGWTVKDIEENFNKSVAQMVDCVSEIDKTKYILDKNEIYEDENFIKSSAEEQTFKKLIAMGKKNPMGFAIKFADRLHNLMTIEAFNYSKQLEKVRESEKWIIPIAEKLNSEQFYRDLCNECFKIVHRFSAKIFLEQYAIYHKSNEHNIAEVKGLLEEAFANSCINEIKINDVREYKIFSDLKELYKNGNVNSVSQGQILRVANYNIYLLYSNSSYKDALEKVLNTLNKKLVGKIKIIDVKIGRFTHKIYYQLVDNIRNKYNLYLMSKNDYVLQKIGTLDGQNVDIIDDENINDLYNKYIKVKTRSGEVKFIPENSTVLDFAFKIHRDLGFGFKYAIVNGSKTKQPPYTKLNEGDKVEIFVDRDLNGNIIPNYQLKWFAYVNTELAKKLLIKEFGKIIQQ